MDKQLNNKTLRILSIVLLFMVSLNALAAGYSFITDPTGRGIGITTDYLKPSAPFKNYLIPGIILFTVIGITSSVIALLAILKKKHYSLLVLMQGCILIGWIGIQLTMVTTFHPLHLIIATTGVALIICGSILQKKEMIMTTMQYRH